MKRVNREDIFFYLADHENAALVTSNGQFEGGLAHNPKDLLMYADVIQEMMVDIMKTEMAREGLWLWKISDNWQTIAGWELLGDELDDM